MVFTRFSGRTNSLTETQTHGRPHPNTECFRLWRYQNAQ